MVVLWVLFVESSRLYFMSLMVVFMGQICGEFQALFYESYGCFYGSNMWRVPGFILFEYYGCFVGLICGEFQALFYESYGCFYGSHFGEFQALIYESYGCFYGSHFGEFQALFHESYGCFYGSNLWRVPGLIL